MTEAHSAKRSAKSSLMIEEVRQESSKDADYLEDTWYLTTKP